MPETPTMSIREAITICLLDSDLDLPTADAIDVVRGAAQQAQTRAANIDTEINGDDALTVAKWALGFAL